MVIRHRLERVVLAITILVVIVLIGVVIQNTLNSDQGPLEPVPTKEPTVIIGPKIAATPATPMATFDPEPTPAVGSLQDLLTYAPDRLADNSLPLSEIAQYADVQRWLESQGIALPTDPSDPAWDAWLDALSQLALPEVLATRGADDIWQETYGFSLLDVYQVLAVGSAPDYVMIIRGNFDADLLHSTWAENGYQAVRVNGVTYWSLNPGGNVDLSAPASRPALGNLNNLVLLDDGTLVATARSGRLEQTLATIADQQPSLAENSAIEAQLAAGIDPEQIVTCVLLKGTVLEAAAATPVATPTATLPEASMLLSGLSLTPNGEPIYVIVAAYNSAADATQAYNRAANELTHGTSSITHKPYADRLQVSSMRIVASGDDESLLVIHATPLYGWGDWLTITEQRDFAFLMWPREP